MTSRIIQSKEELAGSTAEEQQDVLKRWELLKYELRPFYSLKQKEREKKLDEGDAVDDLGEDLSDIGPPKTNWLQERRMTPDERRRLHEEKELWKRRQLQNSALARASSLDDDPEMEQAIRESVRQTSRGDAEEDARVEQAIRSSVHEMRRIAEFSRDRKVPIPDPAELAGADPAALDNITDEEYQALIEQAIQQSMFDQQASAALGHDASDDEEFRAALEASRAHERDRDRDAAGDDDEEEQMRRALQESQQQQQQRPAGPDEDEEEMRRALEESERAHHAEMEKSRTEEEIVMEYVMKQSLMEEELRRQRGKGKAVVAGAGEEEDEEDEELKRALEESLRISGKVGEASGSGSGADAMANRPRSQIAVAEAAGDSGKEVVAPDPKD